MGGGLLYPLTSAGQEEERSARAIEFQKQRRDRHKHKAVDQTIQFRSGRFDWGGSALENGRSNNHRHLHTT